MYFSNYIDISILYRFELAGNGNLSLTELYTLPLSPYDSLD